MIRGHLAPTAELFLAVTGERDAPRAVQFDNFRRELAQIFFDDAALKPAW